MNTQQMSELSFLNTMVNDPISYDSKNGKEVVPQQTEDATDPLSWLFRALNWLSESTRRTRVALPSG